MYQPAATTSRDAKSEPALAPYETPSRRRRRWLIAMVALVGVAVILAGIKVVQIRTMIAAGKAQVPPPESVTSAKVQQVEWQPIRAAVGSVTAIRGVTLSAELTGTVRQINFENGSLVKKGTVLVRFDVSSEEAQLAGAQADAALAKQTRERNEALRKDEVNTQQDLDNAQARDKQARATVVNLQAIINKKIIRAPFDGRVGIRSVELGQVVSPGTPIISLQTVDPIYVEFQLPQQSLAAVRLDQQVQVKVDVFPGSSWEGTITTINPEVDLSTRNVRMRATVKNPDGRLTPGMFAAVEVLAGEKAPALVVPVTAIIYAPYGDSVYVIENSKELKTKDGQPQLVGNQRFVRLGDRRGDYVAVISGLALGETVVSNGAFKLHNGQTLVINNALAPKVQFVPKPEDR
jgi:membrane fusion protein (multidrug efflux system)